METRVITVSGSDQIGIIAAICDFLSKNNVNIIDINQSVTDGSFNMIMIIDITESTSGESRLSEELLAIGECLNMNIELSSTK